MDHGSFTIGKNMDYLDDVITVMRDYNWQQMETNYSLPIIPRSFAFWNVESFSPNNIQEGAEHTTQGARK